MTNGRESRRTVLDTFVDTFAGWRQTSSMPRRGAGEGSVFRRSDGRWCAYLSLPEGGRRYLYGRTRADVQRKLVGARRTQDDGLPFSPERQTVGDFLTEWLEGQRQRLCPNTWKRYEEYVRIHIVPAFGRVKRCVGSIPTGPCAAR